jgi:hypothetical protein
MMEVSVVVGIIMKASMVAVVIQGSVVVGVMVEATMVIAIMTRPMVVAIMMIEGIMVVAVEGPDPKAVSPGPTPTKPMSRSRGSRRNCETHA